MLLPQDEILPSSRLQADYRLLSDDDLEQLLSILPRQPLLAGTKDLRLSLAGAQDKIAIACIDKKIYLPLNGAPSSHIIKPATNNFAGIVYNEFFCLTSAKALGIPAVNAQIHKANSVEYLLVERYDRIYDTATSLRRLHQEDFCQALGIASENKYQKEDIEDITNKFF